MVIKKITIYGYGKWIDQEFSLDPQMSIFYGQNEAGKSTLMSFISSILFGFPTRHSSALRYEPKESSRYGGKLLMEDARYGWVTVERVDGKVTGNVTVTLEDGTQGDDRLLDTLLNSKKRSFFESLYVFDLKGIEETSSMTREQFNRFFLSTGSLGNEQFLKQADQYEQKASQLFKPTGRKPVINTLYRSLQKQKQQLDKAKETNKAYTHLLSEKESTEKDSEYLNKQLQQCEQTIQEYKQLLQQTEAIDELRKLKESFDANQMNNLPADGIVQLKHINQQLESLRSEIEVLHGQQQQLQEDYRPSSELLNYQAHEEAVNELNASWESLEVKMDRIREKQIEIEQLEKQSFELKMKEGLPLDVQLPEPLTEAQKQKLELFHVKLLELERNDQKSRESIRVCELKIENNNEQIDQLEEELWPLSAYREMEKKEAKRQELSSSAVRNKKVLAGAFAFCLLILLLIAGQQSVPLLLMSLLVMSTTLALQFYRLKRHSHNDQDRSDYLYQKTLRSKWKEALARNDQLQIDSGELRNQISKNKQEKGALQESFRKWKKQSTYPDHYDIEQTLASLSELQDLRQLMERIEAIRTAMEEDIRKLKHVLQTNEFSRQFFEEGIGLLTVCSDIKKRLRTIDQEKRMQQMYIKETEKLQNAILYYVQKEKDQLAARQTLFEETGAETEEAFIRAYHLAESREEKLRRYQFLKDSLNIDPKQLDNWTEDSVEVLTRNISEQQTKAEGIRAKQKELEKRVVEINYKISELEEGGLYSDLLQQFENEKSTYQEKVDLWAAYKTAAALIEKTLDNAKENLLPHTIALAEEYFTYLTDGDYTGIELEADHFQVIDKNGRRWEANELSRGTVEPLYIAVRLAFIFNNKEMLRYPVIIDDAFVNIDEDRKERVYALLQDISKEVQVILFTFDQAVSDCIPSKHMIELRHHTSTLR
ncbi:DNA double-strand break repair Rad50 ATPase [Alkalibacterium sp. AK22]|uniref:ATP-binding protein n=1 Tax=Alkalibacterium sp. AK22 TaxID=1229520 RepID=UPI00044CDB65|nr:AAA family ATPase [Alkalibacterium sp. AK22]EXJ22348.1 DNA double-strand break repair Rad50 ATPase [Alkalibacterium sp. AK22]